MKQFKRFLCEEEAMGTLEVILISAVLIGAAILFKDGITTLIASMMDNLADNAIDGTN